MSFLKWVILVLLIISCNQNTNNSDLENEQSVMHQLNKKNYSIALAMIKNRGENYYLSNGRGDLVYSAYLGSAGIEATNFYFLVKQVDKKLIGLEFRDQIKVIWENIPKATESQYQYLLEASLIEENTKNIKFKNDDFFKGVLYLFLLINNIQLYIDEDYQINKELIDIEYLLFLLEKCFEYLPQASPEINLMIKKIIEENLNDV